MKKEKERNCQAALDLLKERGRLTSVELQHALGCIPAKASSMLNHLHKTGRAERKEQNRKIHGTKYVYIYVNNAKEILNRGYTTTEMVYQKVIELKEATLKEIARDLGIKEVTARLYLNRLCAEEKIYKRYRKTKAGDMPCRAAIFSSEKPLDEQAKVEQKKEKSLFELMDECVRRAYDRVHGACV